MSEHYKFINTPLPYGYDALEPYIDTKTMHLHHDKHLQTYTDNLNNALNDYPRLQSLSLEQLIHTASGLPDTVRTPILNNAGGVFNHRFYFEGMSPESNSSDADKLVPVIIKTYGSIEKFMEQFKKAALSVFGSGYAWLVADNMGRLGITTTANQDTTLTKALCPILNIDVWEHSYYVKHYNKRGDYIDDWFSVINWKRANEKYVACVGQCK